MSWDKGTFGISFKIFGFFFCLWASKEFYAWLPFKSFEKLSWGFAFDARWLWFGFQLHDERRINDN